MDRIPLQEVSLRYSVCVCEIFETYVLKIVIEVESGDVEIVP